MEINVIGKFDNLPVEECVHKTLERIANSLNGCGNQIALSLLNDTKSHLGSRFSGSNHWSQDKVSVAGHSYGSTENPFGEINIDIPGASRAYHDIEILPKFRKYLTIPISPLAKGRSAQEFNNTFATFKRDGHTGLIGQRNGATVTWLFRLVKRVVQKKDSSILPTDENYALGIMRRISNSINKI